MSHDHTPPSHDPQLDSTLDLTPLLYPELYDEDEVEQAREALARSPQAQRELERLTQGVERVRVTSARNATRLSEGVSLSAQQRHALLREAQRAHAHTKRLTKHPARAPLSEHLKAFFFSPQLAWVGVLGLMTVSVWRYQQSLELNERAPLTPEVLSHPDLALPTTAQALSADAPAELDDEEREEREAKEEKREEAKTRKESEESAESAESVEGAQSEAPPPPKPQAQGDGARGLRRQVSPQRSARRRAKPIAPSARSKDSKRSKGKASKRDVWRSKAKSSKLKRPPKPAPKPAPKPTPPKEARAEREPTQQAQFAPPPPAPKTYAPPPPPPPPPPSPYPAQSETLSLGGSSAPSSAPSSAASSPARVTSTRSTGDLINSVSSVPWAEADAHAQAGRFKEAISALEGWVNAHMSHPRAREAARLGQRWAKEQSDGSAERRFTAYLRALERQGGTGGGKQSSPRKRRLKSTSKSTMSF